MQSQQKFSQLLQYIPRIHIEGVWEVYIASRWDKGSDSTGVDQRKTLLYHVLVAELVKKIHITTDRFYDAY